MSHLIPLLVAFSLAAGASAQKDDPDLRAGDWGKVDRSQAIATAMRILQANADVCGKTAALKQLREGGGRFSNLDRGKRPVTGIWLEIPPGADFMFDVTDGHLFAASVDEGNWLQSVANPISAAQCREAAEHFIQVAGVRADSFVVSYEEPVLTPDVADAYVHIWPVYQGGKSSVELGATISRADGGLVSLSLGPTYDYDTLGNVQWLPEDRCLAVALDAYHRYKPFADTEVGSCEKLVGHPWMGEMIASEFTQGQRSYLSRRIALPFYQFRFYDAGRTHPGPRTFGEAQIVSVDASTGKAMTILIPGGGLGGQATTPVMLRAALDASPKLEVVGGGRT